MNRIQLKGNSSLLSTFSQEAFLLVIIGIIGYLVSTWLGWDNDIKTITIGILILTGSLAFSYFKRGIRYFSDDLGKMYMRERTGIIEIYENLNQCKEDMQKDFHEATNICLLLQIGRKELGDGESSFFWSLAKEKNSSGTSIRVLRAAPNSPFLSEERAKFRNTPVKRWGEDIRRLDKQIELLKDTYDYNIEGREHSEPYLWRIFIFDDIAYVSGYLHTSDNDKHAFVYKLEEGPDSLYMVFSKYFEYLWVKYELSNEDLAEKWATWQ
ncbi:hypothetical protein [Candidatus Leptofilum sp.]|uniref:hypothetical protein n=1 Tax=Candidatus Leptofilum sp. TaxID=3241576 RepID=UPI003B5C46DD